MLDLNPRLIKGKGYVRNKPQADFFRSKALSFPFQFEVFPSLDLRLSALQSFITECTLDLDSLVHWFLKLTASKVIGPVNKNKATSIGSHLAVNRQPNNHRGIGPFLQSRGIELASPLESANVNTSRNGGTQASPWATSPHTAGCAPLLTVSFAACSPTQSKSKPTSQINARFSHSHSHPRIATRAHFSADKLSHASIVG